MYADVMTKSMRLAIDETYRRRAKQLAYNEANGITPASIVKAIDASLVEMYSPEWAVVPEIEESTGKEQFIPPHELPDQITNLRREMMEAAVKLEYERAAQLRDKIKRLERMAFGLDKPKPPPAKPPGSAHSGASEQAEGRHKGHKVVGIEDQNPSRARGRRGAVGTAAGAATGAAAGASGAASQKQGRLKLVPDRPE